MINDKLNNRYIDIIPNLDIYKNGNIDTKYSGKLKMFLFIKDTLPIVCVNDDVLNEHIIYTEQAPIKSDIDKINILGDKEYFEAHNEERFIFISYAMSKTTMIGCDLYYDKLFKDIIVIPDTRNILPADISKKSINNIIGYRVGSGLDLNDIVSEHTLGVNIENAMELPITKSNILTTMHMVDMVGLEQQSYNKNALYYESFVNKLNSNINFGVNRNNSALACCLELGTVNDLFSEFKQSDVLPIYWIIQNTLQSFTLRYIGDTHPKNNKLYLILDF